MVEDEWLLFHEKMDNPERFLKNKEKKALVYWKTENVLTKVMELLIGFEALEEFYSPTGKLLDLAEENQACLIGRKPSQMSKLDLLQSVMIFPFVTMKLKGRDRKHTTFDQIAL